MGEQKIDFPPNWSEGSSNNTQFKKYDSINKYLKMRDMFFFFHFNQNLNQQIKSRSRVHPKLHVGVLKHSWNYLCKKVDLQKYVCVLLL